MAPWNVAPRINGRRVVVEYMCPATPVRDFDYCASYEGIDNPQGYGPTAEAAFNDLQKKVENRPRFVRTYCSQCGGEFGPGDSGFSHCRDHTFIWRLGPDVSMRE